MPIFRRSSTVLGSRTRRRESSSPRCTPPLTRASPIPASSRRRLRSWAEENDAAPIPFLLDGVAGTPELNQPDGNHPTAEGQVVVAENVWAVLEPLLRELEEEAA